MEDYVNYLSLVLLNTGTGFMILAGFLLAGRLTEFTRWIPGFLVTGFISVLFGLHIVITWPLPASYNIAFGEPVFLSGILFLVLGFSLLKDWSLLSVGIYSFFAGLASVLIGVKVYLLKLSLIPELAAMIFLFSGISGMSLFLFTLYDNKFTRGFSAFFLFLSSLLVLATAYMAYWSHLETFSGWVP